MRPDRSGIPLHELSQLADENGTTGRTSRIDRADRTHWSDADGWFTMSTAQSQEFAACGEGQRRAGYSTFSRDATTLD